jgi:hypothetical protein
MRTGPNPGPVEGDPAMLTDPVLIAIAASTNDALPDHLWRFDTATTEPVADLAAALHRAASEFTGTHQMLQRSLRRLCDRIEGHLTTLTSHAVLDRPHGLDTEALALVQMLERHELHREVLLSAYQAWRRHQPTSRNPQVRHLLAVPYDPRGGMVTLTTTDCAVWQVSPDPVAAAAFGIRLAERLIGEIEPVETGIQPTALTHPEQRKTCPHLVYPLPVTDDEPAACRSLMRWWALRDSAHWRSRTPDRLTDDEQAALAT